MNDKDIASRFFHGLIAGLLIGGMFGGSIIFFLKAAMYPASEIGTDYVFAALVFTFVYHSAIWKITRNPVVAMMAMIALPLMGIISAAGCAAVCIPKGNSYSIPFEVLRFPLIGVFVFVVFAIVYRLFEQRLDQWEESYRADRQEKKKNEYAPRNDLEVFVDTSNLPTYLLSLTDEELNQMVGKP
jgi:hypothetical protein